MDASVRAFCRFQKSRGCMLKLFQNKFEKHYFYPGEWILGYFNVIIFIYSRSLQYFAVCSVVNSCIDVLAYTVQENHGACMSKAVLTCLRKSRLFSSSAKQANLSNSQYFVNWSLQLESERMHMQNWLSVSKALFQCPSINAQKNSLFLLNKLIFPFSSPPRALPKSLL